MNLRNPYAVRSDLRFVPTPMIRELTLSFWTLCPLDGTMKEVRTIPTCKCCREQNEVYGNRGDSVFLRMIMQEERFMRFSALVGEEAFAKIQKSHVAVFGIGGVGSYIVEALARCGIGKLTLVDYDTITYHNINRQIHALSSTVGKKKTEEMAKRIREIHPDISLSLFSEKVTPENVAGFFQEPCDYIADAIDDVAGKIALITYGRDHDIPVLSAMGTGNKLNPAKLQVADIKDTSVCPLCRSVRKKLREKGIESGVNVVYSEEIPKKSGLMENNRPIPASSSFVPSSAGLLMASVITNALCGLE